MRSASLTTGKGIQCVNEGESVTETTIVTQLTTAEAIIYDLRFFFIFIF